MAKDRARMGSVGHQFLGRQSGGQMVFWTAHNNRSGKQLSRPPGQFSGEVDPF